MHLVLSIQFFFKFTKVKYLTQKLQEKYGFNKQMDLLKKSLKTFNQSILNKNPVFSFVSLLTQLRIISVSFLVCSATLKLPTPNPCDLAHTQGIESLSEASLLPKLFPLWTKTEPVKQVYHHGHKCYLIIQPYFGRSFKACIFSSWKYIHAFTLSFVFSFSFLTFKQSLHQHNHCQTKPLTTWDI